MTIRSTTLFRFVIIITSFHCKNLGFAQDVNVSSNLILSTSYNNSKFNFKKLPENMKFTIGLIAADLQTVDRNFRPGISAGIMAESANVNVSVELKYAKSDNNSVLATNVLFLFYPFNTNISPYVGIGLGSASREVDGVTLTSFLGSYDIRVTTGIELFKSYDYKILFGAEISSPFNRSSATKTETITDPNTGNNQIVVKHFESKSAYTEFYFRISF